MSKAQLPVSKAKTAYGLLSDVCKTILAEPLRYNQGWWIHRKGRNNYCEPSNGYPDCGTVGCVAGWVTTLKGKRVRWANIPSVAQRILGLDDDTVNGLFSPFAVRAMPQTREHALKGVKHIRKFQRDHAAQLKATRV